MKKCLAILALATTLAFFLACSGGGGGDDSGTGEAMSPTARVDGDGDGYSSEEGDCDDNDPARGPAEPEICGDGIDQDCDGMDASCDEEDGDGDGYAAVDGDCDDGNAAIHPQAEEICGDGIDQNCDGSDASCADSQDADGDGFTADAGDCDDGNAGIYPGAEDICGDGVDQDCDGADASCTDPTVDAAAFDEFAQTYAESLETENLDLYMSLFSPEVLSDGQSLACFRAIQEWNFRYFDYANVHYQINGSPVIREESGRSLATVNRTVNYSRISPTSGSVTPVESTGEAYFVKEMGAWKVYGDQAGYKAPVLSEFVTSKDVDTATGKPSNITSEFTGSDNEIQMFFTVDNIVNGASFLVRIITPNGTIYSESPYSINWFDFPICARSQTTWYQTLGIFNLGGSGISGVGFGPETSGTWSVELVLEGFGILGSGNFEYLHSGSV
jgi:hypothetical protein